VSKLHIGLTPAAPTTPEVAVEIRAAHIAAEVSRGVQLSTLEDLGFRGEEVFVGAVRWNTLHDEWQTGHLAARIFRHDEEQP